MKSLVALAALSGLICLVATSVRAFDAEAAYLCRSDALRLCMSEIPDRERITACMKANRAELSPGCRTVFNKPSRPGTIEIASRVG
ncbi:hypothetical protein ACIQW5_27810 [Methylorubrum thiocyanatum]|uniref:hypothetical protein n=1 Tax=Methylorubrum thiocyanatum TaxID=47958 RepID=UPI00383A3CC4